jgi:hypothetical protein
MNAGRELDALIAKKVMDWEDNWEKPNGRAFPDMWGTMDFDKNGPIRVPNFPCYSDDIASAWEVVEKMRTFSDTLSYAFVLQDNSEHRGKGEWLARFDQYEATTDDLTTVEWWSGATAPLAICLAALKAVGVEVPA